MARTKNLAAMEKRKSSDAKARAVVTLITPSLSREFKTAEELLLEMGRPVQASSRRWVVDRMRPFIATGEIECERVYRARVDKIMHKVAAYRLNPKFKHSCK